MHYENIFYLLLAINHYNIDESLPYTRDEFNKFIRYCNNIEDLSEEYRMFLDRLILEKKQDEITDIMSLFMDFPSILNCKKIKVTHRVFNTCVIKILDTNYMIENIHVTIEILSQEMTFNTVVIENTNLPETPNSNYIPYSSMVKHSQNVKNRDLIIESIKNDKVTDNIVLMFMEEFKTDSSSFYVNEKPIKIGGKTLYMGTTYTRVNGEQRVFLTVEEYARYKLSCE